MIITLGGHLGSGKSTLGKKLAEIFGYKQYSTGTFMREMAGERGISLLELAKEAEIDGGIIDHILDDRQKKIGLTEDNFIIDGRLAFHFIPHAIKIFLQVDSHEAAKRIFNDSTRNSVIESHFDIEDAANNINIRRKSEDERYMKYYGIHIYDMNFYNIVIDTTGKTPDEVLDEALGRIHLFKNK
ncbi:MAG: AAA family ATPase [Candidatus Altimarinota bacterium]